MAAQKWIKKGLVFEPKMFVNKANESHCQMPVPVKLSNSIYRIFFAARINSKSIPAYFDYCMDKFEVIGQSDANLFDHGEQGFFDYDGAFITSVVETDEDGSIQVFYVGRCNGVGRAFYVNIGTAFGAKTTNILKKRKSPIMQRSEVDPWCAGSCFVIKEHHLWRMWYSSGFYLNATEDMLRSKYNIKYAESTDGINWIPKGIVSIPHIHPGEIQIARPWIIKEGSTYKAWYSYGGDKGYRIGYAESRDGGYTFERMDHLAGISLSDEPWENETIAYPAVIVHKGKKYMFYNGNKFGKDGVALAVELPLQRLNLKHFLKRELSCLNTFIIQNA